MFRDKVIGNIAKSFGQDHYKAGNHTQFYLLHEDFSSLFEEITKSGDPQTFRLAVDLQKSFTATDKAYLGDQRSFTLMKAVLQRGNLVKKQIIDKTGRRQTKWVKRDQTESPKMHSPKGDEWDEKIIGIINDDNLNQTGKIKAIFDLGVQDKKYVAEVTGANYSRVHQLWKQHSSGSQPDGGKTGGGDAAPPPKPPQEDLPKIPVEDRWEAYEMFADMVATGTRKSAIAYGTGGVGKTYTLKKVLERNKMLGYDEEIHTPGNNEYDYVSLTGKATPQAMFKTLYEHNKKLVVFDDIDSVLTNDDSINILKGALDSTGDGTISYESSKGVKGSDGSKIPQRFKFRGTVVFISNLPPDKIPQPLRSRSLPIDLSMTAEETVDRLRTIAPFMTFQDARGEEFTVPQESMDAAIDFLDQYKNKIDIGSLNARTFGSIALVHQKYTQAGLKHWKSAALAIVGG